MITFQSLLDRLSTIHKRMRFDLVDIETTLLRPGRVQIKIE